MSMYDMGYLFGFRYHNRYNPWDDAPPWAIELRQMLRVLLREERVIMSVQSDIADALAKVQGDVASQTTVIGGLTTFIQGLKDQIAALAANSADPATAAALNTLATQIEANTSATATAIATQPGGTPATPPPT